MPVLQWTLDELKRPRRVEAGADGTSDQADQMATRKSIVQVTNSTCHRVTDDFIIPQHSEASALSAVEGPVQTAVAVQVWFL